MPRDLDIPDKIIVDIKFHSFDPTSYSKLNTLLDSTYFNAIFIVLDSANETKESLKNIRLIDEKIRVYLLDQWDEFDESDESYTQVFNIHQLISNRLFDHLPNVPLVAQNVGLAEGEIMEVLVPFGSSFAYRHVGSISQVKWRIVAIYRAGKQILPTAATMIKPQDSVLILGKASVLNNIYLRITKKDGFFPEPFGKNLYLLLDLQLDCEEVLSYIDEAVYLRERLEGRRLIVRVINPGNFELLDKIKSYSSKEIDVYVEYSNRNIVTIVTEDNQNHNIGLIFSSIDTFTCEKLSEELVSLRKLVYLYGDTPLHTISNSVVLMTGEKEMESISATSFYISETLGFELCLCDYDPEGDFESKKFIVEHYETLSHAVQYPINIDERKVNPIRALNDMKQILQIAPLTSDLESSRILHMFSTSPRDYLLSSSKHPKLLVPVVMD